MELSVMLHLSFNFIQSVSPETKTKLDADAAYMYSKSIEL